MKHTSKVTALVTAGLLALSLTACGGASSDGSSPSADAAGGNELTVWTWDPAFNIYAMQEAEKVYQKDHPDFKLNIVETPWDDLQTKLTTIAQAQSYDELPDIFLMQNNAFQKNGINYPDLMTSLKDSGIDFSQFPDGVKAYSTLDGEPYGVPFDAGTAIGAYRTDVLKEAGLTVADFTDITWTDFLAKGKEVKEKTGKALLSGQAGSADTIMMMLQSAGASLFDAEGKPDIANNATLKAAFAQYKALVDAGVMIEVNSWDEYIGTLTGGTAAATVNGVWIVGSIQTADDQSGNWGMTNVPSLDGVSGATNFTANGGSSWAVSSTADTALANDFLKSTFAGSTELYDTILPASGAVANWIPAGQSTVYAEPQAFWGDQAIYKEVVEFGAKVPSNHTGVYYYEGRDAVSAALTKVIGGADVDSALAEAQQTVEFAMQ